MPIIDPENPGEVWKAEDEVAVVKPEKCYQIAIKYRKKLLRVEERNDVTGGKYYVCYFRIPNN